MQGYWWYGLVIPYSRATLDGRLFTGDDTKMTYRKFPIPVICNDPPPSHESWVAGFCNRVAIDSAEGVSASIQLNLLKVPHWGEFWAQADLSRDFDVERFSANTSLFVKAELIGFHLGVNPAWSHMPSIVITEKAWEQARQ